ncbi:MAG: hypothetical protein AAF441_04110 [Pseudomonadota bacterium]
MMEKVLPRQVHALVGVTKSRRKQADTAIQAEQKAGKLANKLNPPPSTPGTQSKAARKKAQQIKRQIDQIIKKARKNIRAAKRLNLKHLAAVREIEEMELHARWKAAYDALAGINRRPAQLALLLNESKMSVGELFKDNWPKGSGNCASKTIVFGPAASVKYHECAEKTAEAIGSALDELSKHLDTIGSTTSYDAVNLAIARLVAKQTQIACNAAVDWARSLKKEEKSFADLGASAKKIQDKLDARWLLTPTVLDGHIHICPRASIQVSMLHDACKLRVDQNCLYSKPHFTFRVGTGNASRTVAACAPQQDLSDACAAVEKNLADQAKTNADLARAKNKKPTRAELEKKETEAKQAAKQYSMLVETELAEAARLEKAQKPNEAKIKHTNAVDIAKKVAKQLSDAAKAAMDLQTALGVSTTENTAEGKAAGERATAASNASAAITKAAAKSPKDLKDALVDASKVMKVEAAKTPKPGQTVAELEAHLKKLKAKAKLLEAHISALLPKEANILTEPKGTWISRRVANVKSRPVGGEVPFILKSVGCVDDTSQDGDKRAPGPCPITAAVSFTVAGIELCPKPYKFVTKYKK